MNNTMLQTARNNAKSNNFLVMQDGKPVVVEATNVNKNKNGVSLFFFQNGEFKMAHRGRFESIFKA